MTGVNVTYYCVMSTTPEAIANCRERRSLKQDITWLLHRAAQRIRVEMDGVAAQYGLRDLRDWIVLTAIVEGEKRTQLAIGQELGLDKTTLTSVLDRLERDGHLVRTLDPHDRRARIPELTAQGLDVQAQMVRAKATIDESLLADFTADEQQCFLAVLGSLAGVDCDSGDEPVHGSCMR